MTNHSIRIPLFKKVIFTDWHGVLCSDYFWMHTLSRKNLDSKSRVLLENLRYRLFDQNVVDLNEWMRGKHTSEAVLESVAISSDQKFLAFALDSLYNNCKKMRVDGSVLRIFEHYKECSWIVVASDNMDCFVNAASCERRIHGAFDDILCSSQLGVLKSEAPIKFFGHWLAEHDLSFADAVLVDDSIQNCEAFSSVGGHSIKFEDQSDLIERLDVFFHDTLLLSKVTRLGQCSELFAN